LGKASLGANLGGTLRDERAPDQETWGRVGGKDDPEEGTARERP
jgi:hypothetical protein